MPDDPALRLRVARALDSADLRPASLPPAAVLLVRQLEDPLPGALTDGDSRIDGAWERALRDRLEALHRSAARPRRGRLPGESAAVVFADHAELLACLARDLAAGTAWQCWWWREVMAPWPGDLGASRVLAAALGESVELLPAVLDQLQTWGEADSTLVALERGDAAALVQALAERFGFHLPVASAAGPPPLHDPPGGRGSTGASAGARDEPSGVAPGRRKRASVKLPGPPRSPRAIGDGVPEPPAQRGAPALSGLPWLSAVLRSPLGFEARLLLALALVLARRPWEARDTTIAQLLFDVRSSDAEFHERPGRPPGGGAADRRRRWGSAQARAAGALSAVTVTGGATLRNATYAGTPAARSQAGREGTERPDDGRPAPGKGPTAPRVEVLGEPRPARHATAAPLRNGTTPCRAEEVWPGGGWQEPVPTRFGGVLYLINLMTALDLPECFETDWRLASRMSPWGLLEALGRALLAAAGIAHGDDPLWPALALLAAREPHAPPGSDIASAHAYRFPATWWADAPGEDRDCRWAAAGQWLRLWSVGGYLLADLPLAQRAPAEQARAELVRLGGAGGRRLRRAPFSAAPRAGALPSDFPPGLARLVGFVLPYLQRRLQLAAGVGGDRSEACVSLLRCTARVHLTSSHVDLVADLDSISLPARTAGLDRDPGWLPQFGRVVLFHYE